MQRIAKIIGTKNIGIMENPFKFGTVVDSPYFTDGVEELSIVKQALNSHSRSSLLPPILVRRKMGLTWDLLGTHLGLTWDSHASASGRNRECESR